jgi:hypothetical protein
LEAAATSMQVHLQMEGEKMVDYYNASLIASAATVAVAANAPFLFGKSLWHDSRIPLFEQAVQVPGFFDVEGHLIQRVGFGSGYLHGSLLELFLENLYEFPVILPMNLRKKPEKLAHLHLHNGTIWRWNRPIVGFNQDGNHHLRIEHRVCSSGPTLVDIVGNVAFYLGLTQALVQENKKLLDQIPFDAAYKNFYQAAQYGFEGQMEWKGKNTIKLETLLKKQWVPMARAGLKDLGIADKDLEYYFEENIIPRIIKRQTGTHWQRKFIKKYGPDFKKLTQEYFQRQERDLPVHQWSI